MTTCDSMKNAVMKREREGKGIKEIGQELCDGLKYPYRKISDIIRDIKGEAYLIENRKRLKYRGGGGLGKPRKPKDPELQNLAVRKRIKKKFILLIQKCHDSQPNDWKEIILQCIEDFEALLKTNELKQNPPQQEQTSPVPAETQTPTTQDRTPSDVTSTNEQTSTPSTTAIIPPILAPSIAVSEFESAKSIILNRISALRIQAQNDQASLVSPSASTPPPSITVRQIPVLENCPELESKIIYDKIFEIYLRNAAKTDEIAERLMNENFYKSKIDPETPTAITPPEIPQAILEGLLGLKFNTFEKIFEVQQKYFAKQNELNSWSYLFSWDNIPGKDNSRLIGFLIRKLHIPSLGTKTPTIEKIDDRTIIVSTEQKPISLRLNDEKTTLKLEMVGEIHTEFAEFNARTEDGKLNIYESWKEKYMKNSTKKKKNKKAKQEE